MRNFILNPILRKIKFNIEINNYNSNDDKILQFLN